MEETMKAVRYEKTGKVEEVVQIVDVKKPHPGKGEVLVKVFAAGMNPVNYKVIEGVLGMLGPKLPAGDGIDVSGEVVEVGEGVSRFIEGDMVWGAARLEPLRSFFGSFAEYVVLSEQCLFRKPAEISHVEAASLGVVAFTGHRALIEVANLKKDQKILILGASGGTGTFGVQLAKHVCGAYVAATCSSRNRDLVTKLGADLIINYQEEEWSEVLKGQEYDVIYDCRGGETFWADSQKVLSPRGQFITIVGDHAEQQQLTFGNLTQMGWSMATRKLGGLFGGRKYEFVVPSWSLSAFKDITKWLQTGTIKAVIDKVIPFENILEAYQYQHSGKAVGKVVVSMVPSDFPANNNNNNNNNF